MVSYLSKLIVRYPKLASAVATIARIDLWLRDFVCKARYSPTRFINTMPGALLNHPWGCQIIGRDGRTLGYLHAECSFVDLAFRLQAPLRTAHNGEYSINLWEGADPGTYFSRLARLMSLQYTEPETKE